MRNHEVARASASADTSIRRLAGLLRLREDQEKGGAPAPAVALDGHPAPHLGHRVRAVVEPDPGSLLAGGEAVAEDPGQVFRGDAFSVVLDPDVRGSDV